MKHNKVIIGYTIWNDGNSNPVAGFYVIVNGIPIGRPWKTYEAAYASMEQYLRELRAMVTAPSCY